MVYHKRSYTRRDIFAGVGEGCVTRVRRSGRCYGRVEVSRTVDNATHIVLMSR